MQKRIIIYNDYCGLFYMLCDYKRAKNVSPNNIKTRIKIQVGGSKNYYKDKKTDNTIKTIKL